MAHYNARSSGVNDDGSLPMIYITSDLQGPSTIDINPSQVIGDSEVLYHVGPSQFLGVDFLQYDSSGPSSPRSLYSESAGENADWESPGARHPRNELYSDALDQNQLVFPNSVAVADGTLYRTDDNSNDGYLSGPEEELGMNLLNIGNDDACPESFHTNNILFGPGFYAPYSFPNSFPTPVPRDSTSMSPNQSMPALSPTMGYCHPVTEPGCFLPFSPDQGTSLQRNCVIDDYQRHHRYDVSPRHPSPYPPTSPMNVRHRHRPSRNIDSQDLSHSDSSPDITTPPPDIKLVVATDAIKTANEGRRIHPARFSCDMCGQNFTTRHSKTRHISSHMGERPFKCSLCGQAFTNKTDCRRHEKSKKRHQLC